MPRRYLNLIVCLALILPLVGTEIRVSAQEATPPTFASPVSTPLAGAEETYADPSGRFTIPIPTNWTAETVDGIAVLASPEGDIVIRTLAVEERDLESAIVDAFRRADSGFALEPEQSLEVPSVPGVERTLVVTYDSGDESGRVVQGVAQLADGVAYVQVIDAPLAPVARRAAQVQIIFSGLEIAGVEAVDLTAAEPRDLTAEDFTTLDAFITDLMARFAIPGAAVAVVQGDEIVYEAGFGVRELGGSEPVTPETRMMIGSTTKSMTTMLMAILVDAGLFTWDTPVVDVLPWFAVADPELTQTMTMRNLVCACTGVPRRDLEFVFNANELTAEDVVASVADFEFFTAFGEAFQYSNQLVATAGYAAAAAIAGPDADRYDVYVAAMQERVLDPIGMTDSTFSLDEVAATENAATPHGVTFGGFAPLPLALERFVTPVAPAGALWSTAHDMARYTLTQLQRGVAPDGARVVSAANLEETWQPQVPVAAGVDYGLGWIVEAYRGRPVIGHGGNTFGFTSDLAFMPDAEIGVVVLANAQAANAFGQFVRYRVFELAFGLESELEVEIVFALDVAADTEAQLRGQLGEAIDDEAVAPYLGDYRHPVLGKMTLRLEGDAERLVLDAGEFQAELLPLEGVFAGERYLMVTPPLVGLSVELRMVDGKPVVVAIDPASTEEYPFERTGGEAEALATPAA